MDGNEISSKLLDKNYEQLLSDLPYDLSKCREDRSAKEFYLLLTQNNPDLLYELASKYECYDLLKFYFETTPRNSWEEFIILSNRFGCIAYIAAKNGNMKIVDFCFECAQEQSLKNSKPLNQKNYVIDAAVEFGSLENLIYLKEKYSLQPSSDAIRKAIEGEHKEILEWLRSQNISDIYNYGPSYHVEEGNLDFLKYLESIKHPLYAIKSQFVMHIDRACENNHIEVLKWLYDRKLYPSPRGLGKLVQWKPYEMLELYAEVGLVPEFGFHFVFKDRDFKMINWLFDHEIRPHPNEVDSLTLDQMDLIELCESRGVEFTEYATYYALREQDLEKLKYLGRKNLYPASNRYQMVKSSTIKEWLSENDPEYGEKKCYLKI